MQLLVIEVAWPHNDNRSGLYYRYVIRLNDFALRIMFVVVHRCLQYSVKKWSLECRILFYAYLIPEIIRSVSIVLEDASVSMIQHFRTSNLTLGISQGGTALFSIGNLMAIALERCKTARCAYLGRMNHAKMKALWWAQLRIWRSLCFLFLIFPADSFQDKVIVGPCSPASMKLFSQKTHLGRIQTMGDLGAKYGFFGEDPGMGGAGEAVTLVDKTGEAWVFHICGGWAGWGGGGVVGDSVKFCHVLPACCGGGT